MSTACAVAVLAPGGRAGGADCSRKQPSHPDVAETRPKLVFLLSQILTASPFAPLPSDSSRSRRQPRASRKRCLGQTKNVLASAWLDAVGFGRFGVFPHLPSRRAGRRCLIANSNLGAQWATWEHFASL